MLLSFRQIGIKFWWIDFWRFFFLLSISFCLLVPNIRIRVGCIAKILAPYRKSTIAIVDIISLLDPLKSFPSEFWRIPTAFQSSGRAIDRETERKGEEFEPKIPFSLSWMSGNLWKQKKKKSIYSTTLNNTFQHLQPLLNGEFILRPSFCVMQQTFVLQFATLTRVVPRQRAQLTNRPPY
jgi:hypothetical protein